MKHAKTIRVACVLVAALLVLHGCKPESPDPYARYGAEVKAKLLAADLVFYAKKFAEAEGAYRAILTVDESCVDARVGLGRSLRYSGKLEEAAAEFRKAYEQDRSHARANLYYGESLVPWWGMAPRDQEPDELVKQAIGHIKKALKKDPGLMNAHLSLWTTYIYTGEPDKADAEMKMIVDKEFFPKPVSDFGYNLLVGAEPGAVIFTNGDMDTYPLLALQAAEGFRTDVRVVNINLLNLQWYARYVRDQLRVPVSCTNEEMNAMAPKVIEGKVVLVSDVLVEDIIENAGQAPIYFAMVPESRMKRYSDRLSREGLLTRVEREPVAKKFNREKAIENVEKLYQIDLPEEKIVWGSNTSPLTRKPEGLFVNYGVIYQAIAADLVAEGKKDEAVPYFKKAADVFRKYEDTEKLKNTVDTWLEIKPDDPGALELKKQSRGDS